MLCSHWCQLLLWRAAGSRLATAQTAREMSWRHGGASWEEWQEPWQWHATSWEQGLAASSGSRGSWPSQGGWSRGGRHGASHGGRHGASHGGGRATSRPPPSQFIGPPGLPGQCISLVWPATIVHSFLPQGQQWSLEWLNNQAAQVGCVIRIRGRQSQNQDLANALLLLTHLLAACECVCVCVSVCQCSE